MTWRTSFTKYLSLKHIFMPLRRANHSLPNNRLKKSRKKNNEASRLLSEWEDVEEAWCTKECDQLSRVLTQTTSLPSTSGLNNLILDSNDSGFGTSFQFDHIESCSTANSEVESDIDSVVSEQSVSSSVGFITCVMGDINKRRRVREDKQWKEAVEPMFKAFMLCRQLNSQWSQAETWAFDYKEKCRCSGSKKRVRNVDLVDILSHKKKPVHFCSCQPDQVRLIQLGYVGGSPIQPEIAFSLRLLRLHEALWKLCCIRTHPFAQALETFHRAALPYEEAITQKPRRWGRKLSCAVDAFRRIKQLKKELAIRAMHFSKLEKLAANCPRCFGENPYSKIEGEPDFIVCIDGNFQQRRHKDASVELSEVEIRYPNLFLHPNQVKRWDTAGPTSSNAHNTTESHNHNNLFLTIFILTLPLFRIPVRRCTKLPMISGVPRRGGPVMIQAFWRWSVGMTMLWVLSILSKAGKSRFPTHIKKNHFSSLTRLFRSYFAHALIDWFFNNIEESKPLPTVGLLYDIGCNIEKGMIKHKIFERQRSQGQIKFGTSVFHAYVHSWSCQLDYNPRKNVGWGMSDGEGTERNWAKYSPLIPPLRYSTCQHRLDALDLKAEHKNEVVRTNSAHSSKQKLEMIEKIWAEKSHILSELEAKRGYSHNYFATQWARQKQMQGEVLGDKNGVQLQKQLEDLIEYEEQLREEKNKMAELRRRRCRNNTENLTLASLPGNIVFLEEEVQRITMELGSEKFRGIPGASDPQGRFLIRIRVAKAKVYEAKVGIVELRARWQGGSTMQQRMASLMITKQNVFKKKWKTFHDLTIKYNEDYPSITPLIDYTFEELKALPLDNNFWNFGSLTHPDEKWAVDEDTKRGIDSYLTFCRCEEELRRIAHEVRQLVRWSLSTTAKIKNLCVFTDASWDPTAASLPIDLNRGSNYFPVTKAAWQECVDVIVSLYTDLVLEHAHLFLTWSTHIDSLLHNTRRYCQATFAEDEALLSQWNAILSWYREQ